MNGRFSEADWVPLRYVNRTYTQGTLGRLLPQRHAWGWSRLCATG